MHPRLLDVLMAGAGLLSAAVLPSCTLTQARGAAHSGDDDRQILWQRGVADALTLAAARRRPLLIAVNMDGESASERIVRELYRDPAFVALTRKCVCLVSSVFRHAPRDFDDRGARIPCPRLGEVTCGEHIALEPVVFEKYLSDGERVAPRHALILSNGEKSWDVSLAFDLREIEVHLGAAVRDLVADSPTQRAAAAWTERAARRDQRGRAALESALESALAAEDETAAGAALNALNALATHGDAGSTGALRILAAHLPRLPQPLHDRLVEVARALRLEGALADVLREQIRSLGDAPADPEPGGREAALPVLAALAGDAPATRSLLLACRALDNYGPTAATAVTVAFGAAAHRAIESGVREHGGAFSLGAALRTAADVTRTAGALPRKGAIDDAMPSSDELVTELEALDAALRERPADPELLARSAKAALDLGRRRIEAGRAGAELLLEDAARLFARALEVAPERHEWWIERARAAYFLGRFGDEAAHGRRALRAATGVPGLPEISPATLDDARVIEALRWIGDGNARRLAERSGGDPAAEVGGILEGLRALATVAASPYGDATDWVSFASLCGALGLWREEFAILATAAHRLPESPEIRSRLNDVLWSGGRIDLAPREADRLATRWPASADAAWFAGYAWMLAAENDRRCERPWSAVAAYEAAAARFTRTVELQPDRADACRYYLALCWLGRGMAHLLADRRSAAADCLVQGVALSPQVESARDGLDRDVLDLVDQILEWRESGPSPVDPLALLDRLEAAARDRTFWALAVADSALREALRADGRNPERVERDTVDAGGNPIRMPMGLPTAAGDDYLRASITAARRALRHGEASESAPALAQSDTIWAERMLQRGRFDGVRDALAEAAPLLGFEPPEVGAGEATLVERARELRAVLGEARPRQRPGR